MSSEIRVRSRFRKEVDDEALGLAFVMLARILAEEEDGVLTDLSVMPTSASPRFAAAAQAPAGSKKPLRQRYYEEVEALKASGWSNAEAVREVARRFGKQESAVRQSIHKYRRSGRLEAA